MTREAFVWDTEDSWEKELFKSNEGKWLVIPIEEDTLVRLAMDILTSGHLLKPVSLQYREREEEKSE
jgi:hypothetical protein